MDKKLFPTAAFILAFLVSTVTILHSVSTATANPAPYLGRPETPNKDPPVLTVQSPQRNTIYYDNEVLLNFTVIAPSSWTNDTILKGIGYQLDGPVVILWDGTHYSGTEKLPNFSYVTYYEHPDQFTLVLNVSRGQHNLQVIVYAESYYYPNIYYWFPSIYSMGVSQTIPFTVDAGPISVSIDSPENKTYDTSDVPLNFTMNEPNSQITYNLDGQANVTVAGNTTLSGLSNGFHNVTVYPTNATGKTGEPKSVTFSVEAPFPTSLVIVPIVLIAIIGVGLLVYFKKRKH